MPEKNHPAVGLELGKFLPKNDQGYRYKNANKDNFHELLPIAGLW
jgi:hypothetical protein